MYETGETAGRELGAPARHHFLAQRLGGRDVDHAVQERSSQSRMRLATRHALHASKQPVVVKLDHSEFQENGLAAPLSLIQEEEPNGRR